MTEFRTLNGAAWDAIALLLAEWWPGEFTTAAEDAWHVGLDGYEPAAVSQALKAVAVLQARNGERFRPSLPEVLAHLDGGEHVSQPTFEEAYRLMFGPRGAMTARAQRQPGGFSSVGEMERHQNAARLARAFELNPLVGSFCERQGISRLVRLELDDPDYGELRRKELREAWERHVEAMKNRQVAALVAGDGRRGLQQLDPLAALGVTRPQIGRAA